jgi:protein-L-isoaspartate(D-aspartate) O-methyltransferase
MDLETRRRFYAEEVQAVANLRSARLVNALASVKREDFLAPGPWLVKGEADFGTPPHATPDGDPAHLYHNYSVAIDPARQLFNGAPALVGTCIDALGVKEGSRVLHVGTGLGYYTALIAYCCGPHGRVLGVEVDAALAAGAKEHLKPFPWAEVRHGNASGALEESFDAILFSAGVTHPREEWLNALAPGGTMVVPLTYAFSPSLPIGKGFVIAITRRDEQAYDARLVTLVAIYSAIGLRDEQANARLGEAMRANQFPSLKRLRRDTHERETSCWLHSDGCCLQS